MRLYLREVRDSQAKARGIAYEKKKRKKPAASPSPAPPPPQLQVPVGVKGPFQYSLGGGSYGYSPESGGGMVVDGSGDARVLISPLSVFN